MNVDIDTGRCFAKLELLFQSHESNVDAAKCSKSVCPACHAATCFTRKDIRRRKLRYLRQNPVTAILHVAKIDVAHHFPWSDEVSPQGSHYIRIGNIRERMLEYRVDVGQFSHLAKNS